MGSYLGRSRLSLDLNPPLLGHSRPFSVWSRTSPNTFHCTRSPSAAWGRHVSRYPHPTDGYTEASMGWVTCLHSGAFRQC